MYLVPTASHIINPFNLRSVVYSDGFIYFQPKNRIAVDSSGSWTMSFDLEDNGNGEPRQKDNITIN